MLNTPAAEGAPEGLVPTVSPRNDRVKNIKNDRLPKTRAQLVTSHRGASQRNTSQRRVDQHISEHMRNGIGENDRVVCGEWDGGLAALASNDNSVGNPT